MPTSFHPITSILGLPDVSLRVSDPHQDAQKEQGYNNYVAQLDELDNTVKRDDEAHELSVGPSGSDTRSSVPSNSDVGSPVTNDRRGGGGRKRKRDITNFDGDEGDGRAKTGGVMMNQNGSSRPRTCPGTTRKRGQSSFDLAAPRPHASYSYTPKSFQALAQFLKQFWR